VDLPVVASEFRWTAESWGAALRCEPLQAVAPHLFTTRQLQLSPAAQSTPGWGALARALDTDPEDVRRVQQVHGNRVVVATADRPNGPVEEADALVAIDPRIAVAVIAADCVPLLMADRVTGAVAAVHAGWRGTAARVAVNALAVMQTEFGTRPGDVVAAIGPAIGACCYEVGTELVDAFAAAGHERYLIDRWFLAPPPRRGEPRRAAPKLRLDVAGANRDQLVLAGVPESQIHLAGVCTAMNLDVLTSYRAEHANAGRLAGAIKSRGSAPVPAASA
jgi:YfiH family protein